MQDHDRNLIALLERAREVNLKLNLKKLRLRLLEVPYIGHLLTPSGVKLDPEKVCAVQEMPNPIGRIQAEKVKVVQRFLGFVNYLARFVPIWLTNVNHCDNPLTRMQPGCVRNTINMPLTMSSNWLQITLSCATTM